MSTDCILNEGIKIFADSDLPGIMNEYGKLRDNAEWLAVMKDLFGIDASNSAVDPNLEDNLYYDGYETGSFKLDYKPKNLIYPNIGFNKVINMWKFRDKISVDGGITAATFDKSDGNPALVFNSGTAISLFSLGDGESVNNAADGAQAWTWGDRYDWLKSIYTDNAGFGLQPKLKASNKYVLVDYRTCADSSLLISLKNYRSDESESVEISGSIITGRTVKSLITNTVIENPCDGNIQCILEADGHELLLAYNVEVPLNPDFEMTVQPISQVIKQGESTSFTIDLAAIDNFSSPVNLSVSGLPEGTTGLFNVNPVIPGVEAVLNITASDSVSIGTYTLKIEGTGGDKTHNVSVLLGIDQKTTQDEGDDNIPEDSGASDTSDDASGTDSFDTGGTQDQPGSEIQAQLQGATQSQTAGQSQTQTGTTQTSAPAAAQTNTSDTESTGTGNGSMFASGGVIVIEKDKDKDEIIGGAAGSGKPAGSGWNLGVRTYRGTGYASGKGTGGTEPAAEPYELARQEVPEISPVEQFRNIMEKESANEAGIIKTTTSVVPQARFEEVIKKSTVVTQPAKPVVVFDLNKTIGNFISGLKNIWQNLVRGVRVASTNVSRRYAFKDGNTRLSSEKV